ncbi:uncharacterized protein KIAA0825-like [Lingula anatina]|uniref:Uncharacterized protein KIAA0825-like n=1 Tax=Lingula anatina TaxID=7574 RepID=A0A2R2MSM4_LINAN|nr:uncharacterized protein KIAA0825-like [Lingula anatina]|eukprot:XP_023933261.1 uncharacterized protein KIAA0825-like [Lingula anatina]
MANPAAKFPNRRVTCPGLRTAPPSDQVLDRMISDIDLQLQENAKQLEGCIEDILKLTSQLPGGRNFTLAKEAVDYTANSHILEKSSCYDPDLEQVSNLFRHVLRQMDEHPGSEEAILESLLQLSSQEGITLPLRSARTEQNLDSVLSLGAICDVNEQISESLWNDIKIRLKKFFLDRLNNLPLEPDLSTVKVEGGKRMDYLNSLCCLNTAAEVWKSYRSLRSQQLQRMINKNLYTAEGNMLEFEAQSTAWESLSATVISMINEDFAILNSGIFARVVTTFECLHLIYQERLSEEIGNIAERLQHELPGLEEQASAAPSSERKIPKSESRHEFGPVANVKSLLRSHSKSLDSLLVKGDLFPDVSKSEPVLYCFVRLVRAVCAIESHIDDLHKTMIWEVVNKTKKKTSTQKTGIRGVLKSGSTSELATPKQSVEGFFGSLSLDDSLTTSLQVVEKVPEEEKPRWKWRRYFKPVLPQLARCLEQCIRNAGTQAMEAEKQAVETSGGHVDAERVCPLLVGGRLDYPTCIPKSVQQFMSSLDRVLPLAYHWSEGQYQVIRTTFVDATVLQLKDFHRWITKLGLETPKEKTILQTLYLSLSAAAFIRNHLLHYETVLTGEDTSKKVFVTVYRQYCHLVESLSQHIVDFHNNVLVSGLLHDAESHHFADGKEFYEDERCSFSIQMWNLHMQRLQQDLWSVCPPRLAQNIYTAVLQESLAIFALRYSRIKPSYRRTKQFRSDITTILLCTSQLVIPSCDSVSKLVDICPVYQNLWSIHNHCSTLLSTLAIVTSPLDILYKIFKRGLHGKRKKSEARASSSLPQGHPCQWLGWIHPGVFKSDWTSYDDMQTTTALYLQLSLLASQPEPAWMLLLQTLLMKDVTLPIMLLTHYATNKLPAQTPPDVQQCGGMGCCEKGCPHLCGQPQSLYQPFFDVLVRCDHIPDALANVILPIIDRTNGWSLFAAQAIPGKTELVPEWLSCLFDLFNPVVERIIGPAVCQILKRQSVSANIPPLSAMLEELPCGCDLINHPNKVKEMDANEELLGIALSQVLQALGEEIYAIPQAVGVFFNMLQSRLQEKGIESAQDTAGLQLLASCLRYKLLDSSFIESLTGMHIRVTEKELFINLGETLFQILTDSVKKGSSTPRICKRYLKQHRAWVQEQVKQIKAYFLCHDIFSVEEGNLMEGAPSEFTHCLMTAYASNVMNSSTGMKSLNQIYNFVLNNKDWIVAQLDIPLLIPALEPPCGHEFKFDFQTPCVKEYNPLEQFQKIGLFSFDHNYITEFAFNWTELLKSDLGLSELGFKTLLYHRHDMQDGAYLEQGEKKPVQALKAKFDVEPAELV